jgi:hypothetical protein
MPRKPKPAAYKNAWAKPLADEAPAKVEPVIVTNCIKGLTVHLGDGRRLKFGETAEVSPALAEVLRAGGMCE